MLKAANHLRTNDDIEISMIEYDDDIRLCHIYMEAQIFTPDSQRFLVNSGASPHGRTNLDPSRHTYWRCDLDDAGKLSPVITEPQALAPSLSPDGTIIYYILDHTLCPDSGKKGIEIKKLTLMEQNERRYLLLTIFWPGQNYCRGQRIHFQRFLPMVAISRLSSLLSVKTNSALRLSWFLTR